MDALIHQVAEENGLEVIDQLSDIQPGASTLESTKASTSKDKDSELDKRFEWCHFICIQ